MTHKVSFFPIGNADTTLIELDNGQKILFDFANMRIGDEGDRRIDLPTELNTRVNTEYDVVCFTHLDNDHICGSSEYFHFDHAACYQGGDRKKIKEMWVPANVLIETAVDGDARILRTEARYRLKNKTGIKVFSRPKKLKDWCDAQNDICFDDIKHLIVNAGDLVPGFTKAYQGIEFFVHSPFFSESQHIDRNNEAIVVQATFNDVCETKMILGSDIDSDAWDDIVRITRHFGRDHRLAWNLFHISHHCSSKALNNLEKGSTITKPTENVKWLFETMGKERARIVSPSWSIPPTDEIQPPHAQAAAYYKSVADKKMGEFKVTMDYPSKENPKTLTFSIDSYSCLTLSIATAAANFAYQRKPSRAGHGN